jgi:hypothetical protein
MPFQSYAARCCFVGRVDRKLAAASRSVIVGRWRCFAENLWEPEELQRLGNRSTRSIQRLTLRRERLAA